jgi:hypothetical protein
MQTDDQKPNDSTRTREVAGGDCVNRLVRELSGIRELHAEAVKINLAMLKLMTAIHGERSQYRMLRLNETIEAGDEYLSDDTVTWAPMPAMWTDQAYRPSVFAPMRRRLPNAFFTNPTPPKP